MENKSGLSENLKLFLIPLLGYAFAYAYQSAYLSAYGLPEEFINIDLTSTIIASLSLIIVSVALFGFFNAIYPYFSHLDKDNPIRFYLYLDCILIIPSALFYLIGYIDQILISA